MNTTILVVTTLLMLQSSQSDRVIDFGTAPGQVNDWIMISDVVMGGVTKATLEYTSNSLVLSGTISLDNYGGFASVKTRFSTFDLLEYSGVRIRYRSTNQRFAFTLEDSRNWMMPNLKGAFGSATENAWTEAVIFFKDFKEYQIGEPTGRTLDRARLKNIVRLGIITTEKKAGPFAIEVDHIAFFK